MFIHLKTFNKSRSVVFVRDVVAFPPVSCSSDSYRDLLALRCCHGRNIRCYLILPRYPDNSWHHNKASQSCTTHQAWHILQVLDRCQPGIAIHVHNKSWTGTTRQFGPAFGCDSTVHLPCSAKVRIVSSNCYNSCCDTVPDNSRASYIPRYIYESVVADFVDTNASHQTLDWGTRGTDHRRQRAPAVLMAVDESSFVVRLPAHYE